MWCTSGDSIEFRLDFTFLVTYILFLPGDIAMILVVSVILWFLCCNKSYHMTDSNQQIQIVSQIVLAVALWGR